MSSIKTSDSGVEAHFILMDSKSDQTAPKLGTLLDSTDEALTPDWNAWAQILALGAPLVGRTPFSGIHRLQPAELAKHNGSSWVLEPQRWSWESIEPDWNRGLHDFTEGVTELLGNRIKRIEGPLNVMLSGGRDSRLLAGLALKSGNELTAWTTSSDTGTSLEELIAAKAAATLGIAQRLVPAHHDRFTEDFRTYARTVEYMTSFHVWLIPVAEQLRHRRGTILDGLGGGVFLGGGFPDPPELSDSTATIQQTVDARFARLARYLDAANQVLAPGVAADLTDRTRADFDPIAYRFADHPNGATLTAYLTRTLPGISLAPCRVLASAQPTAVPIMDEDVIATALSVPNTAKAEGAWYPHLLAAVDRRLADLPTAADLTGRRQHIRRGASYAAAQWYRSLIVNSPVGALLSERMITSDTREWSEQLSKTRPQHLIRGLALLALWLEEYGGRMKQTDPPFGKIARV